VLDMYSLILVFPRSIRGSLHITYTCICIGLWPPVNDNRSFPTWYHSTRLAPARCNSVPISATAVVCSGRCYCFLSLKIVTVSLQFLAGLARSLAKLCCPGPDLVVICRLPDSSLPRPDLGKFLAAPARSRPNRADLARPGLDSAQVRPPAASPGLFCPQLLRFGKIRPQLIRPQRVVVWIKRARLFLLCV
jgi:hypothetical protein